MKERSKERYAQLLMAELLDSLGERESIRALLGDMVSMPVDELIRVLIDDFEKVVARRRDEMLAEPLPSVERLRAMAEEILRKEAGASAAQAPVRAAVAPPPPAPPPTAPPAAPPQTSENAVSEGGKIVPVPSESQAASPAAAKPRAPREEPKPQEAPPRPPAVAAPPAASAPRGAEPRPEPPPAPAAAPAPPGAAPVPQPAQPPAAEAVPGFREPALNAQPEPPPPARDPLPKPRPAPPADAGTPAAPAPPKRESAAGDTEEGQPAARPHRVRVQAKLAPDDFFYLHAVAKIPDTEEDSPSPFFLEEKGITQREFALAVDRGGLRFYLSRFTSAEMNVSKNDMLLLPKQESLQLRGVHAGMLNDLRNHGTLLPFAFGTVVRGGKEGLFDMLDERLAEIRDALEEELATRWWILTLFVLDAKIERLVGESQPAFSRPRERERESYSRTPTAKRFDIKVLERMLQKERKLAEAVHRELENLADRCDIEMMVDLGGGSSEDWKQIFKASYEVPHTMLKRFHHAVADLQYQHIMFDLMLTLEGNRGSFSFGSPDA